VLWNGNVKKSFVMIISRQPPPKRIVMIISRQPSPKAIVMIISRQPSPMIDIKQLKNVEYFSYIDNIVTILHVI
jgi:hypothetical protein